MCFIKMLTNIFIGGPLSYISKITPVKTFTTQKVAALKSQNPSGGNNFINSPHNKISFNGKYDFWDESNDPKKIMEKIDKAIESKEDCARKISKIIYDTEGYYETIYTYQTEEIYINMCNFAQKYAFAKLEMNNMTKEARQLWNMMYPYRNPGLKGIVKPPRPCLNIEDGSFHYRDLIPIDSCLPGKFAYEDKINSMARGWRSTDASKGRVNTSTEEQIYDDVREKIDLRNELIKKIDSAKDQLRPFIEKLASDKIDGQAVLPNCIMLVCDRERVTQTIVNWLDTNISDVADHTFKHYYKDCDTLQNEVIDALEEAEEKYQRTGRRTIIHVNGFDKLMDKRYNSPENIAALKEYMDTADEDYHSTIIFRTTEDNIKNLDKGTLQPHRVGLRIDIPISDSDECLL